MFFFTRGMPGVTLKATLAKNRSFLPPHK